MSTIKKTCSDSCKIGIVSYNLTITGFSGVTAQTPSIQIVATQKFIMPSIKTMASDKEKAVGYVMKKLFINNSPKSKVRFFLYSNSSTISVSVVQKTGG